VIAWLIGVPYQLNETTLVKSFLISAYTTIIGSVLFPVLEKWLKPTLRARQYELF